MSESDAIVTYYQLVEQARAPQPADGSAAGTLPTRATRYCAAATSAAGFGHYVFPPMAFSLMWDGEAIFWHHNEAETWMPLDTVQFPHMSARFDAACPPELRGCAPPFLTALPEPGLVQVWTGLFARTRPGWSLLVRGPANLPSPGGFSSYEGIVEADAWFGPLFTNLRLTRTMMPIRFDPDRPLLQVQPLPRLVYAPARQSALRVVSGPDGLTARDWAAYGDSVAAPAAEPDRPFGRYAIASRKRARSGCPYAAGREAVA